jgi:hypothetical protein
MPEIDGPDKGAIGPSPREIKMYKQEYVHGANLFQKALQHYSKSDNPFQKEEFKEVMEKALHVLNETAKELKAKDLAEQNEKISKDYATFNDQPTNEKAIETLNKDLEQAKKSVL